MINTMKYSYLEVWNLSVSTVKISCYDIHFFYTWFALAPTTTGKRPRVNVTGLRVAVDWSECFTLNGPLDRYELLENGLLTFTGKDTKFDLKTRPRGEKTYIAKATTTFQGRKVTVTAPQSATVTLGKENIRLCTCMEILETLVGFQC